MAAETITHETIEQDSTAKTKKKTTPRKRASSSKKTSSSRRSSSKTSARTVANLTPRAAALPRELGGLVCGALALGLLLSLLSFSPADIAPGAQPPMHNLIGPVGAHVAHGILSLFGLGALCFDALLWYLAIAMLLGKRPEWRPSESAGQVLFVLSGTMIAHLAFSAHYLFFSHSAGGFVGSFGAELIRGFFGTVGAYILCLSALIVSVMFVTDVRLSAVVRAIAAAAHKLYAYTRHQWRLHRAYSQRVREERERLIASQLAETPEAQAALAAELSLAPIAPDAYAFEENFEEQVSQRISSKLGRLFGTRPERAALPAPTDSDAEPSKKLSRKEKKAARAAEKKAAEAANTDAAPSEAESWSMGSGARVKGRSEPSVEAKHTPQIDDASSHTVQVDDEDVIDMLAEARGEPAPLGDDQGDFGPRIVESSAKERARRIKDLLSTDDDHGVLFSPQKRGDFELPAISFLNYENMDEDVVDIEQLREMAAQIEKTLRDFKVEGQIKDICPGPVITVFEFSPAAGVKISKIANLADDLAMALAALSVRIVAPIPGKGVVGIEVPNPTREIVYMKEIIADKVFYENKKMALPMGLGKDTSGNPVVTDLAKMPHLLVAGATGSGKSVAVNTMITSLLYRNSPDDVRLIMVDPKMLEFSIYADIPHLLLPVVTDPKQATVALNWAVQEMERRYQLLADLNVRNIKGYNQKVEDLTLKAQQDMEEGKEDSKAILALGLDANGKPEHEHMPYIVVIIDEFADLMMTASKDVETAVARLAQKARAAGLHLILATQRPSTDVITGLIKANFPTRIALRVTSKTDSRVILDSNGAENLLGNGDMLFVPPGSSYIQRVHGAYVSEKEIEKIVDFLKEQGEPRYNEQILAEEDEDDAHSALAEMDRDEHYEDAVRLVAESKQASISMIQRKLRVGYNRAARMVEMMEMEGLVSPPDGCRPREVIMDECPY